MDSGWLMKRMGAQADLPRLLTRWRAGLLAGIVLGGAGELAGGKVTFPADQDLFGGTNVLRIRIDIPVEGMRTLRGTRMGRDTGAKPKARATVTEGGRVFTNVTVQLKGFTSFRSIDDRPGLTLNFDKLAPGQRFHGLSKISLNNSVQDPTRLNEKLARELFAAASVPVARADYAELTLNGRALGWYVVTEGFDRAFLRRHFERPEGTLFQGGVLQDIDRPLEVNVEGKVPAEPAVRRLLAAAREPDPGRRWHALEACLDLERYLSMAAMETILCHSDSYSMNRNNYRLYHDPGTDKLVFLPHGMDRVLGAHRSGLDLRVVPPVLGLVSRALLSTAQGRRRHVERVAALLTNVFDPDRLCARVRALDGRIAGEGAEELCAKIVARAADLKLQLGDRTELLVPPPVLEFDAGNVAHLPFWKLRPRAGHGPVSCEPDVQEGRYVLRLRGGDKPFESFEALLHVRVQLPAGKYRVQGRLTIQGGDSDPVVLVQMVRSASGRFGFLRRALNWREADLGFEVGAAQAPEEIEFTCEIRDVSPEVRFDGGALLLVRE